MTTSTPGGRGWADFATDAEARRFLEDYLRSQVEIVGPSASITSALVMAGGFSNATWLLELSDARNDIRHLVMRQPPTEGPLEPYDIFREAAILDALSGTGVPVPSVYHVSDGQRLLGQPFLLMEYLAGEVPDYRSLPLRGEWAEDDRRAMGRGFVSTLAEVQRTDWRSNGLARILDEPSSDYPSRSRVDLLENRMRERVGDSWQIPPIMSDAGMWLRERAVLTEKRDLVLVHGDFKVGNLMWRDRAVVALLDWELAALGDPTQDIGYLCHPIMRLRDSSMMGLLMTRQELFNWYEEFTGRTIDPLRLQYYMVFALYFHAYTVVMGLHAVAFGKADFRGASMYSKLSQVTEHLVREIKNFEVQNFGV